MCFSIEIDYFSMKFNHFSMNFYMFEHRGLNKNNLCAQGAKRTEAPKLQSGTRWEEAVTNSKNNCGRGMEEKRGAVDERQKG